MNIKTSLPALLALAVLSAAPLRAAGTQIVAVDGTGNNYQTVLAGSSSTAVTVKVLDNLQAPAGAPSNLTVFFTAYLWNGASYTPISAPNVLLSTNNFTTAFTQLTLTTGTALSPAFKVKCALTGYLSVSMRAVGTSFDQYAWYSLNVLPATASFTNIGLRTDSQASGAGQTFVTITPDRDGANDSAVITADPPDPNLSWEVLISSLPFTNAAAGVPPNLVRHFYMFGAGFPAYWNAENEFANWRTVDNGTYSVRMQMAGGAVVNDSLSIRVQSSSLSGTVVKKSDLSPVADVDINCWGPGGGASARSRPDGTFFLGGLKTGQSYTVEFRKDGLSTFRVQGQPADTSMGVIQLEQGAKFRFHADISNSAPVTDLWGGVNVHNAGYDSFASGTTHFVAGSTSSDNGLPPGDSAYSVWTVMTLKPRTTYTIDIDLPELGHVTTTTVTGVELSTTDITLAFTRKANVTGGLTLPQAAGTLYGGESVSVDATLSGDTNPTFWGGGFVPAGQTTGTYRLSGLNPGTYTLRTWSPNYVSTSAVVTIIGSADQTGINFPTLSEGGKSTGTITVTGDTTGVSSGGCPAGQFSLYLNAWSPTSYRGSSTQICLGQNATQTSSTYSLRGLDDGGTYRIYTYLQGFQLNPPGPVTVTIVGNAASKDINLLELSGALLLKANIPSGDDPTQISYDVSSNGGEQSLFKSGNMIAGATATEAKVLVKGLGTGLFRVSVTNDNAGRGLEKTAGVAVTNGSTATLTVDLVDPTYSVSGSISLLGNLSLQSPFNVTVSSALGLQLAAGLQGSTAPVVRVESFGSGSMAPKLVPATITAVGDATFTVTGLPNGSYRVMVRPDVNPSCPQCTGDPEFASTAETVFIQDADAAGVALVLSNGFKVSGTLSRPSGDSSTDNRNFWINLSQPHGSVYFSTSVSLSGVASAPYSFSHVPPGDYSFFVSENSQPLFRKYAAVPPRITVGAADVSQDITLVTAGQIVGKLRDADTNTLITSLNKAQFLSQGFYISAQADPWIEGGSGQVEFDNTGPGIAISTGTGQFSVTGLIPGASYDVFFNSGSGDGAAQAQGQKTYASVVVSGVQVSAAGQVVDVGIVDMKQGVEVSGKVMDAAGNPLSNIQVEARRSVSEGHFGDQIRAFTNDLGVYVLKGIDRTQRYYNIVASPRFNGGDIFGQIAGNKYAQETIRMVDVRDDAKRVNNDFRLTLANATLVGLVKTVDNGPLVQPFGEGGVKDRKAGVFLHQEGVPPGENPLGEIEEDTDQKGVFSVNALKPGLYTVRIMSGGYVMALKSMAVSAGTNDMGTITLQKGAKCSGTLLKPDGTSPNSSQVNGIVAVDDAFEEFVSGSLTTSGDAVTGYSLDGFKEGPSYSLIAFGNGDDLMELKSGLTFSAGESKTVNLVFRPTPPAVFVTQSRSGDVYSIRFFSTHRLRNLTADDRDMTKILTVTQGTGTVVSTEMSSSRDTITLVFQAPPNQASFKVHLAFTSNLVDLDSPTGDNFTFAGDYVFYAGILKTRVVRIPNATGGACAVEGETTSADFPAGTFDVAGSSQVQVGVQNVANVSDLSAAFAAPRLGRAYAMGVGTLAQRLGPRAYPSAEVFKAAAAAPSVSPFSSFYDFFLPAGVSHALKKEALLTLNYDSTLATDPAAINVYYYEPNNGVYLLENEQRQVDTVNKTITVAVRHLSTFVVLNGNAQVIGTNNYTGADVTVHNFPNPFNLASKTLALNSGGPASTLTTDGTVIKFALPAGKSGTVKIDVYDAAGTLVRRLSETAPSGGSYYYTAWDGTNDAGKKVASGVYLGRLTVNDGDEKFFKMAVVK